MGIKDRIKRLEQATQQDIFTVELKDGTTRKFPSEALYPEAFINMYERVRAQSKGEPMPPAHPFTEALLQATDECLERLRHEQGMIVGLIAGEEPIIRGDITREEAIAERRQERGLD